MEIENQNVHILVVDDEPKVRLLLRRCFEPEGYIVSEAADRQGVLTCLSEGRIDLVTLDLNLGAEDGLSVAKDIKAVSDAPIIMVTGKGDVIDRVVGLELGADDYISKPFHIREVLARVRTVLRRGQSSAKSLTPSAMATEGSDHQFSFAGWEVDLDRLNVCDPNGNPVDLTTGEITLLGVFLQHPGRVLNRDQIMDLTKGFEWTPTDRSIDNQIARLRKKIELDPKHPVMIKTVRGAGYTFAAPVDRRARSGRRQLM